MKPNILWIMTDQFNARCLSALGSQVRTPNLDRLMEDGVNFSSAFSNNPICAPSRLSFISGQYCHTHRILTNDTFDMPYENHDTVSAIFRRMGWQTGMIGKSHMIKKWDDEGFEYIRYCDLCDAESNNPFTVAHFQHLYDHGLANAYDYNRRYPGQAGGDSLDPWKSEVPFEHCIEKWTGDETLEFLKNREEERPFFLQMSFQRPHPPFSLPYDMDPLYDPAEIELPDSISDLFENRFQDKHPLMRRFGDPSHPVSPNSPEQVKEILATYYTLITMIDEQIGRTLDYLRETGQYDNTIIAFTADHGDFAGEHGLVKKNIGIFESIQRIPMILMYPGCPENKNVDGIVESVDLAPTLLELAGLEAPKTMDGVSMQAVAEGISQGKNHAICEWVSGYPEKVFALRTKKHRLVFFGGENGMELYDREKDPGEIRNVADNPEYLGVKAKLLATLLEEVGRFDYCYNRHEAAKENKKQANTMVDYLHRRGVKWNSIEEWRKENVK